MFGLDTNLIKVALIAILMSTDRDRTPELAETILKALYEKYGVEW